MNFIVVRKPLRNKINRAKFLPMIIRACLRYSEDVSRHKATLTKPILKKRIMIHSGFAVLIKVINDYCQCLEKMRKFLRMIRRRHRTINLLVSVAISSEHLFSGGKIWFVRLQWRAHERSLLFLCLTWWQWMVIHYSQPRAVSNVPSQAFISSLLTHRELLPLLIMCASY